MLRGTTIRALQSTGRSRLSASSRIRAALHCVRVLLSSAIATICCSVNAQGNVITEYQLKAAYLFNFVAFTEWPADVGETLTLCIYGLDPFGANIDSFQDKDVNGRRVQLLRTSTAGELGACQIVFISGEVISNLRRALDQTDNKPVLTVADSPGAAAAGVSLNMNMEQNKVTFEVNLAAVRSSKLEISFQLLRLAKEVHQ
jgi:hypothetical protein